MLREIKLAFQSDVFKDMKKKLALTYALLIGFNILAWAIAFYFFYNEPTLLALCALAYGFGLRHAVDADHIAAIDNVTRKFMQEKKTPVTIGTYFSLGHSTIVILMSIVVAVGTIYARSHLPYFQELGGIIGTWVSGMFLLIIAMINLLIFFDIFRTFNRLKNCADEDHQVSDDMIEQKGVMTKVFKFAFKFVSKPWHMYIVGVLFGLGFDTASEIAVLAISGAQAAHGVSIWVILIYPLLFTAGMCLIDTTDGVLMVGVYGWAFIKPLRKLFYNMTITFVSFCVAFFIGGLETLAMIAGQYNLQTGLWYYINKLNDNFGYMGYCIIGIFVVSWIIATFVYKMLNLEEAS